MGATVRAAMLATVAVVLAACSTSGAKSTPTSTTDPIRTIRVQITADGTICNLRGELPGQVTVTGDPAYPSQQADMSLTNPDPPLGTPCVWRSSGVLLRKVSSYSFTLGTRDLGTLSAQQLDQMDNLAAFTASTS